MSPAQECTADRERVLAVLGTWAYATRAGRRDEVLANHAPDAVIFDVLPPMAYESAAAYRAGWDEWQPETQGEGIFQLESLSIACGDDVAFAYGFIRCGGTLPDGTTFEDLVRGTFCLQKIDGDWQIVHQHISKPLDHT